MGSKVTVHYTIHNNGDGAFSVRFLEDDEAAQLACDLEDFDCPHNENYPKSKVLEFDDNGKLLNPTFTKAQLRRDLAEARGDDEGEEPEQDPAPQGPRPPQPW